MTKSDKQRLLISYVNDLDEKYLDEMISELGLIDDDNDFMCDRDSKAKEYAKFIYKEGYSDPMYFPEVIQTIKDFKAGFKAGMRFCNEH
jgi:hypothetical protein